MSFPTAIRFAGRRIEVRYPRGPMLLYFSRGARGRHERGWYSFWTVCGLRGQRRFNVRVPVGRRTIADRLRELMAGPKKMRDQLRRAFYVRPSTEIETYRWLITHAVAPHDDARYCETPRLKEWGAS